MAVFFYPIPENGGHREICEFSTPISVEKTRRHIGKARKIFDEKIYEEYRRCYMNIR